MEYYSAIINCNDGKGDYLFEEWEFYYSDGVDKLTKRTYLGVNK